MRRRLLVLLLAVAGCHDNHKPPVNPVVDAGSQTGDHTDQGDDMAGLSPSELDFTFALPGAALPLHAHVAVDAKHLVGEITILDDYPTSLRVTPRVVLTVVGFTDLFKPGYCDDVRQNAQVAATSTDANRAATARKLVRQSGAVPLRVPVSPLLGVAFRDAAETAARAAGAVANRFEITNPLEVDKATLAVSVDATGATSSVIGSTDEFAGPLIQSFNSQADTWVDTAEFDGAIGAKDFLCDLVEGKGSLQINLTGSVSDQPWKGYSWTAPLVEE